MQLRPWFKQFPPKCTSLLLFPELSGEALREWNFPPFHCSVVFENSRTAKISSLKASFAAFLMPLALAWAKQVPRLHAQFPTGTPWRPHTQGSVTDNGPVKAGKLQTARGQIRNSETQAQVTINTFEKVTREWERREIGGGKGVRYGAMVASLS